MTEREALLTIAKGFGDEEIKTIIESLQKYVDRDSAETKPLKNEIVRSWKEAYDGNGFYIQAGEVVEVLGSETIRHYLDVFKTKREAESALAFAQLSHIVDDANVRCAYSDSSSMYWYVVPSKLETKPITVGVYRDDKIYHLPMLTEAIAEACLARYEDLWRKFWML